MSRHEYPTTTVCDVGKDAVQFLQGIRPLHPDMAVWGPAYPVRVGRGDNKALHLAMDDIPPGSVIVIDGQGAMDRAVLGDLVVHRMMYLGIAGVVVNGCVRDSQHIADLEFPTFCKGVAPFAPTKNVDGEINEPLGIDGVAINPGDIVVGDADGVVIVPAARWDQVVKGVPVKLAKDEDKLAKIEDGHSMAVLQGLKPAPEEG